MSQVFLQITPTLYTENTKPAFSTDRLSVIRWKATEKQPKPHAAVSVSVPRISILAEPTILQSALQAQTDELQDRVVRELIEANSNKLTPISATSVDADAIAAFCARENESKRLSKDSVEAWFNQYCADNLMLALASKFNKPASELTELELQQLNNNVKNACTMLASLAGPRSSYPPSTLQQLQKVITLSDETGKELQQQLMAKITSLLQPKAQSLDFAL